MASYRFEITCGDQSPRRAASLRGAKVTMGRLMNNVPTGTRGEIREDGQIVIVGECYSLGWFVIDEKFALQVAQGLVAVGGVIAGRPVRGDRVVFSSTGNPGIVTSTVEQLSKFDGDRGPWAYVEFDDGFQCWVTISEIEVTVR